MDLLRRAEELYAAGDFHESLQAAQIAAERAPRSAEAWRLLARVSRHAGLPNASDDAFRRAAQLSRRHHVPVRLDRPAFEALVAEARAALSPDARRRLGQARIRVADLPSAAEVRAGVSPDAMAHRARDLRDQLSLYQVNLENGAASPDELRGLLERTLSRA